MKKRIGRKLILGKETLRSLSDYRLDYAKGLQTGTGCSNVTDTCFESCAECPTDRRTCGTCLNTCQTTQTC